MLELLENFVLFEIFREVLQTLPSQMILLSKQQELNSINYQLIQKEAGVNLASTTLLSIQCNPWSICKPSRGKVEWGKWL